MSIIHATLEREKPGAEARNIDVMVEGVRLDTIDADREAVIKALSSVLRNAVKFSPEGARVRLRTRKIGENIEIFVQDHGVGIAREALARVGRPFEQIESPLANGMKGSGLGLAIARSLVELHGGSMHIRSSLGVGTVVRIRLPILAPPASLLALRGAGERLFA